ncbi:M20/M25/M40 family metallo-hydrolase [Leucobacter allii]|uniref:M20 family metallopeptidase n=1 Tax=Leucobacter allii TaxID=2932247 RepID=UPI001FD06C9C|nr:M20/M25/M40 family metallo-hydrolase [Leucobacter allii]UOR01384.1 M20/M25/M40 family metallo-hydrolase [Leucobacter allii]
MSGAVGGAGAAARAIAAIDAARIAADTCELIGGRGENPGETEAETVRRLRAACERIGATVELQELAPGRPNLHAAIGPEDGPAVLFLGHSDVVPAGEGWSADAFAARRVAGVRGEAIVGRGAADMKGGLAAVLAAMAAVHGEAPGIRLELLCTVDEEDRSQGVRAWLAEHPPRDYLACIVAEPTDLEIVIGCRGATNLAVDVVGASAHAGRPADGASSISAAARIVELVRGLHDRAVAGPADPLLGTPTWNVGTIAGGSGTSMVPRATSLTIDRRTMPGEDPGRILDALLGLARADIAASGIAGAERIEVRGRVDMVMPGFRADDAAAVVGIAADALRRLGAAVAITGWTAACEGGFIAEHHGAPTIILGPGDINAQAHQPDERVELADLVTAARAYALIALGLAASSPATPADRGRPQTIAAGGTAHD